MTYLIIGGTLLTASLLAFAAVFQYKLLEVLYENH